MNPPPARTTAQPGQTPPLSFDPARLLLWIPPLAAAIGLAILTALRLAAPPYVGLLSFIIAYSSLALFGPRFSRAILLNSAAPIYAVLLLLAWVTALYLLPGHPATPMVRLAVLLHLTTVYVFLFVQLSPSSAARWAWGTLALLILTALPHAWRTLGQTGVFDSLTLPVTLLFSHGALITVLHLFSTFRDQVTHADGRAQALHDLAHRDPLTGLLNRRALARDLEAATAASGAEGQLAVIDVDGLKEVNDRLGHAAGDDLLRRFAEGFTEQAGAFGQVYRISGDEFALLLPDDGPAGAVIVDRVTQAVRAYYPGAAASVGATRRRAGETADAWLSRADDAMYRHKRRGGPGR
ncbi:GGDEF domain-containing protein [Deinococcus humi]|uniref:Diguanylate cyclase (GGDEF)-like protein n=1 Tax=Deinococcus humi TaxID=662880 RepID=A0A7W8K201_9DEIO|nr:GGDEF domain-containing protein [Deinococcus humi]MBB5365814.1 diguanylate cyclase (GGDEF)-like protein [Deinococcus humi]